MHVRLLTLDEAMMVQHPDRHTEEQRQWRICPLLLNVSWKLLYQGTSLLASLPLQKFVLGML
jgi:hypothetical protein